MSDFLVFPCCDSRPIFFKKILRSSSLPLIEHISHVVRMFVSLDTEADGSNPGISILCHCERHSIRIASVDSAVK